MVLSSILMLGAAHTFSHHRRDAIERVLRCRDEIIDTGKRTPEGQRVLKLVRTGCYWSDFDPPDFSDSDEVRSRLGSDESSDVY